jgi:hypothetical protein
VKPAWLLLTCPLQLLSATAAQDPGQVSDLILLLAPGTTARYVHDGQGGAPEPVVSNFSLSCGTVEKATNGAYQWLLIDATKPDGNAYRVWLLTRGHPTNPRQDAAQEISRFILQRGSSRPQEFRDRYSGAPVLPSLGGWTHLFPRPSGPGETGVQWREFPPQTRFLGRNYRRESTNASTPVAAPADPKVFHLLPDLLVGLPSNTRQKDPTRRYDGSDYAYVRLTRADYQEMADAGINCVRVDKDQLPFVQDLDVFYWGLSAAELSFPECLYDSRYLGPTLFLDEPAVCTRDYVLRPRLAKDEAFRQAITPQLAFDAFREFYRKAWQEGAATTLFQALAGRHDVQEMRFLQENLFSWETMVSTAAYQLSQDERVPEAIVFEPPGRVGARRTLPELDMTYGCQIHTDNPNDFIDIVYGFLRGAARLTGKQWGTSIYGAVDRTDAFWFLTHAYNLGASRFFFWDNGQQACVPYPECLALARAIKMRAENYPARDLERLRQAAEVAILLPAGYNLGHVQLGKGNLWGLSEFNLERRNSSGVTYRTVMGNFFTEVERCLRLGIAFDLVGEFPGLPLLKGYREVVRIREDGLVEIIEGSHTTLLDHARVPARPPGAPPTLTVTVSPREGSEHAFVARAVATETSAPIFYTLGTDSHGVYHNAAVAWELYGTTEADHRFIMPPGLNPRVTRSGNTFEAQTEFQLTRPGTYRLRAATVDTAGRSTAVWTPITLE